MVSEKQANAARQQHLKTLVEKGAHAVGVEEGGAYGKEGFVVVAHVASGRKVTLPKTLHAATTKGDVDVPVVVQKSEPFTLE